MKIIINGEILEVSGGGALPEGTVAIKPLTQAEYNALTDAEKQADVVYAITDDDYGGSSSGEVYSTKEIRIGTWVDGKPIYKKTVIFDNLVIKGFSTPTDVSSSFEDVDAIVRDEVFVRYVYENVSYADPADAHFVFRNGVLSMARLRGTISITATPAIATLWYTKTTDTGGAS